MKEHNRLIRAIQEIDNVIDLIKDNDNAAFIKHHLLSAKLELRTQLTNLTDSSTIQE